MLAHRGAGGSSPVQRRRCQEVSTAQIGGWHSAEQLQIGRDAHGLQVSPTGQSLAAHSRARPALGLAGDQILRRGSATSIQSGAGTACGPSKHVGFCEPTDDSEELIARRCGSADSDNRGGCERSRSSSPTSPVDKTKRKVTFAGCWNGGEEHSAAAVWLQQQGSPAKVDGQAGAARTAAAQHPGRPQEDLGSAWRRALSSDNLKVGSLVPDDHARCCDDDGPNYARGYARDNLEVGSLVPEPLSKSLLPDLVTYQRRSPTAEADGGVSGGSSISNLQIGSLVPQLSRRLEVSVASDKAEVPEKQRMSPIGAQKAASKQGVGVSYGRRPPRVAQTRSQLAVGSLMPSTR
eukprot:TRINITY_DN37273_c0_g1_i1.p1 TRINITY_DN37273_c0_g1~~TRINITY_DN37273_c0_g1_i1.p1  ORF type:complete len:349 (+),score=56.24 TRINITY_DN37273_c0_g1_i1:132-1178(+)